MIHDLKKKWVADEAAKQTEGVKFARMCAADCARRKGQGYFF